MEYAKAALAIVLTLTQPVYANVQVIHKGDVAPNSGFLFDADSEKQAEQDRQDAGYYKDLSDKLTEKTKLEDDENQILEKRLQLYVHESNELSQKIAQKTVTEDIIRIGAFSLGVALTAFVFRNARP